MLSGESSQWLCKKKSQVMVNSLPEDRILDWSKLKAFADDKIKVLGVKIFGFDRYENIMEKEKMLVTCIFSFSLNVFKRVFTQGHQSWDCVVELKELQESMESGDRCTGQHDITQIMLKTVSNNQSLSSANASCSEMSQFFSRSISPHYILGQKRNAMNLTHPTQ